MGLLRRQKRTSVKAFHVQCRMMGLAALRRDMLADFVKPEPGKTVQIHPICHESGESKGVLLVAYEDYVRHNLHSPIGKTIYTYFPVLLAGISFVYTLISLN